MFPSRHRCGTGFFLSLLQKKVFRRFHIYTKLSSSVAEYFKIGKLVGAFGLKGELVLKHVLGKKTSLNGLQAIFIEETKKSFLPWFIQSTRNKNDAEVYIKLENIDTRENAIKFVQKNVWLPDQDFKKIIDKSAPAALLDYNIIHEKNALGLVLEVMEQPHQVICRIDIRGKEVLIPLNDETLQKIDHKKKEIHVQLPEGLLEVYL
ncbi:MAG: 16S rRNA processing protein RimM [Sphingobacteriales bacterium UTBCD1]|nr:MAG: 16S rRNA processing protein RimM [Sphingobacteriales bacterium UTBCD1]